MKIQSFQVWFCCIKRSADVLLWIIYIVERGENSIPLFYALSKRRHQKNDDREKCVVSCLAQKLSQINSECESKHWDVKIIHSAHWSIWRLVVVSRFSFLYSSLHFLSFSVGTGLLLPFSCAVIATTPWPLLLPLFFRFLFFSPFHSTSLHLSCLPSLSSPWPQCLSKVAARLSEISLSVLF